MPSHKSIPPGGCNHAISSADVCAQVPEVQHDFNGAGNRGPYMLLQPRTSSCASGKKKALSEGNLRTDSVKEVEGDGISPQEHQLVLFSFCSDEDVICKGPGNTANRKHGFGPRDQHECNEGRGQGAAFGDAHGVSMGFPEHACYRVIVNSIQVEGAVGMPKLGWETSLKENFAQNDQ